MGLFGSVCQNSKRIQCATQCAMVDELLDRLGTPRFSDTGFNQGYWQSPLSSPRRNRPSPLRTVCTSLTRQFGLFGAPATFQRLMDRVLRPHAEYAVAYLDDVIIHSDTWQQHLQCVAVVLESLRLAGLTANPKNCVIGWRKVRYLRYHLGGQLHQQLDKTDVVTAWPQPETKMQMRAFLGLAGYYKRFIPAFAGPTSPLTHLTRKGASSGPSSARWHLRE